MGFLAGRRWWKPYFNTVSTTPLMATMFWNTFLAPFLTVEICWETGIVVKGCSVSQTGLHIRITICVKNMDFLRLTSWDTDSVDLRLSQRTYIFLKNCLRLDSPRIRPWEKCESKEFIWEVIPGGNDREVRKGRSPIRHVIEQVTTVGNHILEIFHPR